MDQFTRAGGTRLDVSRVAVVAISWVVGTIATIVASVVLGMADVAIGPLRGLASFLGELVAVTVGFGARLFDGAWAEAGAFVLEAGPAGFVVAAAIVAATFWMIALIGDRV